VVLAAALGFGAAAANCLGTFLVSTAVESGLSPAAAGWTLSLGSATGIVGRLVAGKLADRRGRRHLYAVASMLVCGAGAELALASGASWVVVAVTPVAFGLGWAWPGVSNLAIVRNYAGAPARATGVTQTGVYIGAVVGPLGFGIAAQSSYALAWVLTALASALSAALVVLARRQLVRALGEPQGKP
jgi:MFS family permease